MTDTMLVGARDLEERNLCRIGAYGWRYTGADVVYEQGTTIIGGPLLALTTGLVSAADNARRRRVAEMQAAPRWRPLGWLDIIATSRRLLVLHQAAWWSVWYSAVTNASHDGDSALALHFHDDAPYCLLGRDVPLLARSLTMPSDFGAFPQSSSRFKGVHRLPD